MGQTRWWHGLQSTAVRADRCRSPAYPPGTSRWRFRKRASSTRSAFIGFEATAVFRDEARRPERTTPRATYLAVLIIGVFYAISCWALVEAAGPDHAVAVAVAQDTLSGKGNMMLDTAHQYLGT